MFDVAEPASPKPGNGGLKLLEAVSNVIGEEGIVPEGGGGSECEDFVPEGGGAGVGGSTSAAERYFDAWNLRQRGREVLRRVEPWPARPRGTSTPRTPATRQTPCRSPQRT